MSSMSFIWATMRGNQLLGSVHDGAIMSGWGQAPGLHVTIRI